MAWLLLPVLSDSCQASLLFQVPCLPQPQLQAMLILTAKKGRIKPNPGWKCKAYALGTAVNVVTDCCLHSLYFSQISDQVLLTA